MFVSQFAYINFLNLLCCKVLLEQLFFSFGLLDSRVYSPLLTTCSTAMNSTNCDIAKLPDELLVQIFEFLSPRQRIRMERICRRWESLSKYSWIKFHELNSSTFIRDSRKITKTSVRKPRINCSKLKTVLSRGGKYLKLFQLSEGCDDILNVVARFCPNLEVLQLQYISLSVLSLQNFAVHCRQMKSVSFYGCFVNEIIDLALCHFFRNCPLLTSLNLSISRKLTGRCFCELPIGLHDLQLIDCRQLENEGIRVCTVTTINISRL